MLVPGGIRVGSRGYNQKRGGEVRRSPLAVGGLEAGMSGRRTVR